MRVVCLVDRVRELSRTRARTGGPKAKRQYEICSLLHESQCTDLTMPRMVPTTNPCQSPLHIPSYRHSYPNWPASAPSAASRLRASNHHPPPLEEVIVTTCSSTRRPPFTNHSQSTCHHNHHHHAGQEAPGFFSSFLSSCPSLRTPSLLCLPSPAIPSRVKPQHHERPTISPALQRCHLYAQA